MAGTAKRPLRRGDAVRFIPVFKKNRIHIIVDGVFGSDSTGLVWVSGTRFRPGQGTDSQAQRHSYLVQAPGEKAHIEILEEED